VQKIIQGHVDLPLTEKGVRQAAERSATLKHLKFADAFSSDLFRAKHTAEVIAADHALTVKTTELLREQNFGKYNGISFERYLTELHDLLEYRESLSENGRMQFRIADDAESYQEMIERLLQFFRPAALAYPGKNVLVVSHGGLMRLLLVYLGWAEHGELPPGAVTNAGLIVLQSDGIEFWVEHVDGVVKDNGWKE